MMLSQFMQMCNHRHSPVLEHFHHWKEFLYVHCSQFRFPSPVPGDDLLSFPVSLAFLDISHINGIIQIVFCIQLLSLSIVSEVHLCCMNYQFISFCCCYHFMLILSPVGGYLDCLQFGAIMIDAAVITCFHFSWFRYPGMKQLSHVVKCICLTF